MEPLMRSRIRAGDQRAFAELFDECAQAVYRHAVRITANRSDAEDIVSLTFLEAWRLRERLHEDPPERLQPRPAHLKGRPERTAITASEDTLLPWLLGIATNVLRNAARSARRHRAALARMPQQDSGPGVCDQVVDRLSDEADLRAAKDALAQLRRSDRELIALCVWSGLSYVQAAEALSIPVGTVRSRLSRARARLRKLAQARVRTKGLRPLWEPSSFCGQLSGDRITAVRSVQETHR